MFDPESRYVRSQVLTAVLPGADGKPRSVNYISRRLLPPPPQGEPVAVHTVLQGERLDLIAARYLGDPTLFWQLCDSNNAMRPEELTETIGRTLRVDPVEF